MRSSYSPSTVNYLINHIRYYYVPRIKNSGVSDRCKTFVDRMVAEIPGLTDNQEFVDTLKKLKEAKEKNEK